MRHLKRTAKLGRKSEHRNMMLANLVCSLIKHRRVTTTLAKAKAARSVAEKMVTLGKRGTIHDRRLAAARLHQQARTLHRRRKDREKWRQQEDIVRILFEDIAPNFKDRPGGYTRIVKLHQRRGDAAQTAILEWVDTVFEPAPERKERKKGPAEKAAEPGKAEDKAETPEKQTETAEKPEQAPAEEKSEQASESTGEKPESENKA